MCIMDTDLKKLLSKLEWIVLPFTVAISHTNDLTAYCIRLQCSAEMGVHWSPGSTG